MKILALDTTEATASAALTDGDRLIGQFTLSSGNTHSETLLPMIDALLSAAKMTVGDVDMIAAAIGPGSFTGLRIGAATAKGLALPFGTLCVGVSSVAALAENAYPTDALVCPVINARRGQFFTGLFDFADGNRVQLIGDCMMMKDEIIADAEKRGRSVIFVGSGADEFASAVSTAVKPCGIGAYESAYSVAKLAYAKYSAASEDERKSFTAAALNPVYLRKAQAERELEERLAAEKRS